MQKLVSMLVIGGLMSMPAMPASACGGGGGGGGGCGMSGGGYGGGRAVAYGKVSGRAPMLAQAKVPTTTVASAMKQAPSAVVKTVATKAKLAEKATSPIFTCPMHPQVQWTKSTDCPICGMKLKLKQTKANAVKSDSGATDDHAGMKMDDMSGMSDTGQEGMGGMDDMMCCPGGMMNMGGMSKANGKQAPVAGKNASRGSMQMAGMGCGC